MSIIKNTTKLLNNSINSLNYGLEKVSNGLETINSGLDEFNKNLQQSNELSRKYFDVWEYLTEFKFQIKNLQKFNELNLEIHKNQCTLLKQVKDKS